MTRANGRVFMFYLIILELNLQNILDDDNDEDEGNESGFFVQDISENTSGSTSQPVTNP